MKWRSAALLLCVCLLFSCTACRSEQDDIYSQALADQSGSSLLEPTSSNPFGDIDYDDPDYIGPPSPGPDAQLTPAPDDDLSGQLVIRSFVQSRDPSDLYWLAREFMELHPQVTVLLDFEVKYSQNPSSEELQMMRDSYYANLRMELTSGEADYLLYGTAQDIDYTSLARSGVIEDLRPYWENDPEIQEEDYFMPVIEAFSVDGMFPVIPYAFYLNGTWFDKKLLTEAGMDPAEVNAVDAEKILTWYETAREQSPDLQLFFTAQGKEILLPREAVRYIDLKNRTASFQSPEFVDFLERSRNVINEETDPELVRWGTPDYMEAALGYHDTGKVPAEVQNNYDAGFPIGMNVITKSRDSFAIMGEMNIYDSITMYQQPYTYLAGPYPVSSSDGHLAVETGQEEFMMPTSMKNKDLAWEFIKYCLSEREELTFDRYGYTGSGYYTDLQIPVNKANYGQMAEDATLPGSGHSVSGIEIVDFEPVEGEKIIAFMESLLQNSPVDLGKYNLDVDDYLEEFYVNEITTPEECAQKIQGRAEIWLNE